MRSVTALVLLAVILLAPPGCAGWPPERDRGKPADPRTYETNLREGGIYRLKQPAFLIRWKHRDDYKLPAHSVMPEAPLTSVSNVPPTMDQYYREGPKKWSAVVAVLPIGTPLRYEHTRMYGGWPTGAYPYPCARIEDERWSRVGLVEFRYMCDRPSPHTVNVDRELLEVESDPPPLPATRDAPSTTAPH
jgi:hypothetical protein